MTNRISITNSLQDSSITEINSDLAAEVNGGYSGWSPNSFDSSYIYDGYSTGAAYTLRGINQGYLTSYPSPSYADSYKFAYRNLIN